MFSQTVLKLVLVIANLIGLSSTKGNYSKQVFPQNFSSYDVLLSIHLSALVENEFPNCFVVIVYDELFVTSEALNVLVALPNVKQIMQLSSEESLENVIWVNYDCNLYIFLLRNMSSILEYCQCESNKWNYLAKYLIVIPSEQQIINVFLSKIGKKTEFLVGIIPSMRSVAWTVYYSKREHSDPPRLHLSTTSWSDINKTKSYSSMFGDMKHANFGGSLLKVVIFEWAPAIFYERNTDGTVIDYYGTEISLLRELASTLNFTLQFMEPPINEFWGEQLKDGNWTGLTGLIFRNDADMAFANLFITEERKHAVDFSFPTDVENACFMTKKASPLPRWQAVLRPFKLQAWLSFLASFVFFGVVLTLLAYFYNKKMNIFEIRPGVKSWIMLFGICVREATLIKASRSSLMIFFGTFGLFCLIITTAYSSNLTAFLTVPQEPKSVDTISELAESTLEVGSLGPFYKSVLLSAGDKNLKILGNRFVPYNSLKVLFEDINKGKTVMIENRQFLEYASVTRLFEEEEDPKNIFRLTKECFAPFIIGIYLQKHSILKRKFDDVIIRMTEAGLTRKWFLDGLSKARQLQPRGENRIHVDGENEGGRKMNLSISHLQGIFILFILGLAVGSVAFVAELIIYKQE